MATKQLRFASVELQAVSGHPAGDVVHVLGEAPEQALVSDGWHVPYTCVSSARVCAATSRAAESGRQVQRCRARIGSAQTPNPAGRLK